MAPFAPKSGEQDDQIPPIAEVATKYSTVSIKLGKYAATLSPFLIFIFSKKLKIFLTFLFNSLHDLIFLKPFSLINVIALELSFLERILSAKFSLFLGRKIRRAPGLALVEQL